MTRVLVEEYYESCYMSTIMIGMRHCPHLKQCSCGRNEDDGRQLSRQPQINVYYSTAVSYIQTRVGTFSAKNTFYTSVGSETGLKRRILFCPTICGLENKRSRSSRYMTVGCSCGFGNERSRSTRLMTLGLLLWSREREIPIHRFSGRFRLHFTSSATVSGTKDPDP
jgi:hypothetical protein